MPLSNQYLVTGIDFSTLTDVTSSTLNQAVNEAITFSDKGIVLVTTDTAVDTADIPDTATYPEFKKHLWLRKKHADDPDQDPILYCFSVVADDWISLIVDVTDLLAQIVAAQADATLALANIANTDAQLEIVGNNTNTALNSISTIQSSINDLTQYRIKRFISAEHQLSPLVGGSGVEQIYAEAHGFSKVPEIVRGVLICTDPDAGYAVNDEIDLLSPFTNTTHATVGIVVANIDKITFGIGATGNIAGFSTYIPKKDGSGGAVMTRQKWAVRAYAYSME